MTTLQPLDHHPANPDTLTESSGSLATQAGLAQDLDAGTRNAYSPVPVNWGGVGEAEARSATQLVTTEAAELGGHVAGAAVAVAYWAACVRDFNTEVTRIISTVNTAGTDPAVADLAPEDLADVKQAARRQGNLDWHTAYDTHIVAGRTRVTRILTQGPSEELILALFQAGLLPMSVVTLYPNVDFGQINWRALFANLRARGVNPSSWAALGTYDSDALKIRLDLLRESDLPPRLYADLLQMYWVTVAAEKAGIDLSKWDPSRGAGALSDIIENVYRYYGDLFLENPELQWAGMANMIGPSFAAGFMDLHLFRRIADALDKPGVPVDVSVLANLTEAELRFFETTFLSMQREIFFDQAMMHEAYLGGGLAAIEELRAAGLIDQKTEQAWGWIDMGRRTGSESLIELGNEHLLWREQHEIIQNEYSAMRNRPVTGEAFTYLMTAVGEPSVPGAQSFADYRPLYVTVESPGPEEISIPFTDIDFDNPTQVEVNVRTPLPDGNLADFDDRWTYITEDTLPAYQELLREDPERARELIASDVGERIDDYRLHHRIDSLLHHYATDWGADVDQ